MRNTILLLIAFLFACHLPAQTPDAVKKAFQQKFPEAKSVSWDSEDDGTFEADFKKNKQRMSAVFDANGNWLETETAISPKALPDAVKAAISKNFPGFETDEAERVEKADGTIVYEVELEKEADGTEEEVEAVFSADGQLLKQERETADDGADDDGENR